MNSQAVELMKKTRSITAPINSFSCMATSKHEETRFPIAHTASAGRLLGLLFPFDSRLQRRSLGDSPRRCHCLDLLERGSYPILSHTGHGDSAMEDSGDKK